MNKTEPEKSLKNKLIVVTRSESDCMFFKQQLESWGADVYTFPTIKTVGVQADALFLQNIALSDWIIFTSAKGIDFFIDAIKQLQIDLQILKNNKIAVVGPKTAQRAKEYGLHANFIPTKYTTEQIAKELAISKNLKILLARSAIGSKKFALDLQKKGAIVIDIPIYRTEFVTAPDPKLEELLKNDSINYITFTSPSTIEGFLERIIQSTLRDTVFTIPIISIGPVTTKKARTYGFQIIITSDTHTTNGMIKKLLEIV